MLRDQVFIVRSKDEEKSCSPEAVEEICREKDNPLTESRCWVNTFIGVKVSASHITKRLSAPPVARKRPDGDTASARIFPVWPSFSPSADLTSPRTCFSFFGLFLWGRGGRFRLELDS